MARAEALAEEAAEEVGVVEAVGAHGSGCYRGSHLLPGGRARRWRLGARPRVGGSAASRWRSHYFLLSTFYLPLATCSLRLTHFLTYADALAMAYTTDYILTAVLPHQPRRACLLTQVELFAMPARQPDFTDRILPGKLVVSKRGQ